jgi:hypothetical protein
MTSWSSRELWPLQIVSSLDYNLEQSRSSENLAKVGACSVQAEAIVSLGHNSLHLHWISAVTRVYLQDKSAYQPLRETAARQLPGQEVLAPFGTFLSRDTSQPTTALLV